MHTSGLFAADKVGSAVVHGVFHEPIGKEERIVAALVLKGIAEVKDGPVRMYLLSVTLPLKGNLVAVEGVDEGDAVAEAGLILAIIEVKYALIIGGEGEPQFFFLPFSEAASSRSAAVLGATQQIVIAPLALKTTGFFDRLYLFFMGCTAGAT